MRARLPLLLAMAALLLIAVVASRGDSAVHPGAQSILPVHHDDPGNQPNGEQKTPGDLVSTIAAIGLTGILLIFAALALFGLAIIVLSVSWTRARRAKLANPVVVAEPDESPGSSAVGAAVLRSAVAAARDELDERRSGPPSDAVVAAWLRLEQAAAESGVARAPHQTPTEFTTVLLAGHLGDNREVDRLRALYQRARFGRAGSVTEADADAARAALGAILDGWQVSV